MALINNNKFSFSKGWLSTGLKMLKNNPEIFSKMNQRKAMTEFIAGSAVVKSINYWMQSTQLSKDSTSLSEFGLIIEQNDSQLDKSSTWWAIHLQIAFSDKGEPYNTLFKSLDSFTKEWQAESSIKSTMYENLDTYAKASVDSNYDGVKKVFTADSPLMDLGLVEYRGVHNSIEVKLGSPKVTDEAIIYGLALTRFTHFKSRQSIDFAMLIDVKLNNYLCMSRVDFKKNIQRMSQMNQWKEYFVFDQAANLESITFKELCLPKVTLKLLLQQGEDTWL